MLRKSLLLLFVVATSALSLAQSGELPANKELVAKAQSVYVESHTFHMRREKLESALLGRSEFKAWGIRITERPEMADLLIAVRRVPLYRFHYTYTVTDRATGTVVMAGSVNSIFSTASARIGDEIVDKMKAFRGDTQAPQATADATPKP